MCTYVYVAELDGAGLAAVANWIRLQAPFAILENVDDICFPASDATPEMSHWDKGWLFGAGAELRWERRGEKYCTRLAIRRADEVPADLGEPVETFSAQTLDRHERAYYLWGQDTPALGRALVYEALSLGGRAQLDIEEFRDPASGVLLFYRYMGMRRE